MGGGSWTTKAFSNYVSSSRGITVDELESMTLSASQTYRSNFLQDTLRPWKITRECVDSDEHPNTVPVILALDVTGSMGAAAVEVAKKLNQIMTDIYADESIKDVEFCIMGIGDLAYDDAPIQMSQFESDVRIAEQLDKIYFEHGGGGNSYESYTAAWYMGVNHCKLDCWKRGKKGIIITLGDECPNPHLPKIGLSGATGDRLQGDVETKELKVETMEKFDVYHISIDDHHSSYEYNTRRYPLDEQWRELVGVDNYFICNVNNLAATITNIIVNREKESNIQVIAADIANSNNEVKWSL